MVLMLSSTREVANTSSWYVVGQSQQVAVEEQAETSTEGIKPRRNCNQGISNVLSWQFPSARRQ